MNSSREQKAGNSNTDILPTAVLGPHLVTRLIIGGNPICGYSHFSQELDAEMRSYHTVENSIQTLLHAEAQGINTMVSRGDEIIFNIIRKYREAGGKMQWICPLCLSTHTKISSQLI